MAATGTAAAPANSATRGDAMTHSARHKSDAPVRTGPFAAFLNTKLDLKWSQYLFYNFI